MSGLYTCISSCRYASFHTENSSAMLSSAQRTQRADCLVYVFQFETSSNRFKPGFSSPPLLPYSLVEPSISGTKRSLSIKRISKLLGFSKLQVRLHRALFNMILKKVEDLRDWGNEKDSGRQWIRMAGEVEVRSTERTEGGEKKVRGTERSREH